MENYKSAIAALLVLIATLAPHTAQALVAIPEGFSDGSATDVVTISGTFENLSTPLAPPFVSPNFSLSFTVPAMVTVSAGGPVLTEFFLPVSGSYVDGGQTYTFANQIADFGSTNAGLSTYPNDFNLGISNLLTSGDFFHIEFQASGSLFSPAVFTAGEDEMFTTGGLSVSNALVSYSGDPPFTGSVSIEPAATAVPEPAFWIILMIGLGGLGTAIRLQRTQGSWAGRWYS